MNSEQLQNQIWDNLSNAIQDRTHGWRTPVLATVDSHGTPQARHIVLREADRDDARLTFYTDDRSPKVKQISQNEQAQLVFWSESLKWQLRLSVLARINGDSDRTAKVWDGLRNTHQAADYLSPQPPGEPIPAGYQTPSGMPFLTIVDLYIQQIDWLALDRAGHKRAISNVDGLEWVTP